MSIKEVKFAELQLGSPQNPIETLYFGKVKNEPCTIKKYKAKDK